MKYFDIPEKEFEALCDTMIDELGFSVRIYSVLRRCGCETLADIAFLSVEEVQKLKNAGKHTLSEVQEKLEEQNITLMTQEEKQQLLNETEELKVLKRKIKRLEVQEKRNQERIQRYESERAKAWQEEWQKIKENREQVLRKAHEIISTNPYPVAGILQGMRWGGKEGCSFCEIFKLKNKDCFVLTDSQENKNLEFSCEECIETFLTDYYWEQKISAKLKEQHGEVPKMLRMRMLGCCNGLVGRCPVCKQQHKYDKYTYYCSRCGTFLDWDEENWEEETRAYYDLVYCDEEDDFIEEE